MKTKITVTAGIALALLFVVCPFMVATDLKTSDTKNTVHIVTAPDTIPAQQQELMILQGEDELLYQADIFRDGIYSDINYPKALMIYRFLAKKGNLRAINSLGGMYRHGFGVEQRLDSAVYYYRMASTVGYGTATYNLANLYRQGEGVEQDFEQAVTLYNKAYEQGYKQKASYMLGYLHYKGLGTEQNYLKALDYFQEAIDLGHLSGFYFVALCHLYGYGVPQDMEKGRQYMAQALEAGVNAAAEFLSRGYMERISSLDTISKHKPYRKLLNMAANSLSGVWEGKLLYYDWSGKKITGEKKLSLQLNFSDDKLSGTWVQDDSVSMRVNGHLKDSIWTFDNMQYINAEFESAWQIVSGKFQIKTGSDGQELEGNISQFIPAVKEPVAPVALELKRSAPQAKGMKNEVLPNSLTVTPNPFTKELHIAFRLAEKENLILRVYDLDGQTVYQGSETCTAGKHEKLLSLDVPQGTYCVSIKGKNVHLTSLVIKK